MSNLINQAVMEEAAEYIDRYTGTIIGKMLERAVEANDLEQIYNLTLEVRDMERMDDEVTYMGEATDVF